MNRKVHVRFWRQVGEGDLPRLASSMVTRGTHSVRYDAERRPVRVSHGADVPWRASYDADGARRKRADAKGTIHYLGGYERNVGNGQDTTETITKYYRALGRLIAIRKNGILYWVGTDHLGGTIRVADAGFDPVGQMRYSPYGVSRDDPSLLPHDYLFTDQQLDASIGLYWYGSRAYDAGLGRFVCPDTIVPSARNPQALNRYSYSYNNPMRYTDPSGHDPWEGQGIVELEHPDWLPTEERQGLYEHNTAASSGGGGGKVWLGGRHRGECGEHGDGQWRSRPVGFGGRLCAGSLRRGENEGTARTKLGPYGESGKGEPVMEMVGILVGLAGVFILLYALLPARMRIETRATLSPVGAAAGGMGLAVYLTATRHYDVSLSSTIMSVLVLVSALAVGRWRFIRKMKRGREMWLARLGSNRMPWIAKRYLDID